ncbi:hypothetical protein ACFO4N_06090 [Camelliibacillus cellulosilyticus]|uniref:Small secreted protein n=1 Tax=Camelliibacillus cellulosilyticus TaxID=2174486 RepID=A0ABV9GJ38_9BACL
MKGSKILIAAVAGAVCGYYIKKTLDGRPLKPEGVLSAVKKSIKKDMDIDGAWIFLISEEWKNGRLNQKVYRGGITEATNGEAKHYDFIADADTGTVLRLDPQS